MRTKILFAIILFLAGGIFFLAQGPAAASPSAQAAYPSPTPGPNGIIIYIVMEGDTCERLSLLYGVSVEYIRTTNLLDQACTLPVGQPIQIGVAEPATATQPGPGAGTPSATPTSTPVPGSTGSAKICVLVYNDANGDALRQETEGAIAGAALSLTNSEGTFSQTLTTLINPDATVYQGMCFIDIPPGKYNISAAAPDGYNPTVEMSSSFEVTAGDVDYVNFGAQVKSEASPTTNSKGPSPLLGILGATLLMGGVGLGVYAWRSMRKG